MGKASCLLMLCMVHCALLTAAPSQTFQQWFRAASTWFAKLRTDPAVGNRASAPLFGSHRLMPPHPCAVVEAVRKIQKQWVKRVAEMGVSPNVADAIVTGLFIVAFITTLRVLLELLCLPFGCCCKCVLGRAARID